MEVLEAVRRVEPSVRLVAWTQDPYALAVASARTCYAADFVYMGRLSPKGEKTRVSLQDAFPDEGPRLDELGDPRTAHERRIELVERLQLQTEDHATRDALAVFADLARQRADADVRIAQSIYEAGHHTPFQHPTFVFALEDVSRHVVESFFHQHMFYNSEQQSQRYVKMDTPNVYVPASIAAHPQAQEVYDKAMTKAWAAYHHLRTSLVEANIKTMGAIGRIKGQTEKQIEKEAEKKAQEMARYVIPVAAATRLYHTVSGIVLLRYMRMSQAQPADAEAAEVVRQMVEAVKDADPRFFQNLTEDAFAADDHIEASLLGDAPVERFEGSRLVHATPDAAGTVMRAIREVTGTTRSDDEVLAMVLDPGTNPVWNDTLNTWDHSPVLRALRHVHLTFQKRQSLTAFAQDQRHRLTPGTRPLLQRALRDVDAYVPDIIDAAGQRAAYDEAIQALWQAAWRLQELGIPANDCTYLLPNATNIHYTQSGDLLSFIHKWRLRLCFNAQKEIFEAALDELRQAQNVMPALTRWLGPPCSFVAAAQPPELQDSVEACCPEGPRWCGVKVWQNFDAQKGRPKRPY